METVTHVVLLHPKAEASEAEMRKALDHVIALQDSVPGITSLNAGPNRSRYHQGFTYGIIMRFIDEAHLNAHHTHPAHIAVVEELDRLCERIVDLDLPG